MRDKFDIIVIGAGHAGCEAAIAGAKLGSRVLLVTMDLNKIAQMSCNPSIGGIAKGQIVREIDALGGYMGLVSDASTLQFRMLNRSKGPAMWSPRAQVDRMMFSLNWRYLLENEPNLFLWQDSVVQLIMEKEKVIGVRTTLGASFYGHSIILTAGTFLGGRVFVGRAQDEGGRVGEPASHGLSQQLSSYGIAVDRMKTGTPARVDIRTVDLSQLIEQQGDEEPSRFSYLPIPSPIEAGFRQRSCYIAHTSLEVHDILREGFKYSPMFQGDIQGLGPRYCPSIEDKLNTFSGKDSHQLFLEPEGWHTNEYYLQGFSSSLPLEVQYDAIQKVKGLENALIYRPGYAVEYDYFQPTQLYYTLESRALENLYMAGQVNGTTGYEEAAAQGMVAAINAHHKRVGKEPFGLARDQAYIGVLIDDLITKGVDEPYRMFTSRAEYRILLRQDNGDSRLTEIGHHLGLASEGRMRYTEEKYSKVESTISYMEENSITPEEINPTLEERGTTPLKERRKIAELLTRPQLSIDHLSQFVPRETFSFEVSAKTHQFELPFLPSGWSKEMIGEEYWDRSNEILDVVEILIKYRGYIERERRVADKLEQLESLLIPEGFDFSALNSISIEGRQKLMRTQPRTIGAASRIPGVSPADVAVLLLHFGR